MPYRTTKRGELQQLQYEITNEIRRDAPEIAQGVFGDNAMHPDMATISNDELDDLFRQKYLTNDRQWLQGEARRDPDQFLTVAKRIGVQLPPIGLDGQPMAGTAPLEKTLPQNAAVPPPAAPPAAMAGMGGPMGPSPAVAPPMPAALPAAQPPGPIQPPIQPPLPGM